MERESTKHGRRIDEELHHETASILQGSPVVGKTRDDLRQEDPDEGLDVEGEIRPDIPDLSEVTGPEADARAELARAVAGARFPADRAELIAAAQHTDAGDTVFAALSQIPENERFANVQAIWERLGGHREHRDAGDAAHPKPVGGER